MLAVQPHAVTHRTLSHEALYSHSDMSQNRQCHMSLIYHFNRPRPHYAQSVHVIASIVRSYGIRPEHTHVTNATYTV